MEVFKFLLLLIFGLVGANKDFDFYRMFLKKIGRKNNHQQTFRYIYDNELDFITLQIFITIQIFLSFMYFVPRRGVNTVLNNNNVGIFGLNEILEHGKV